MGVSARMKRETGFFRAVFKFVLQPVCRLYCCTCCWKFGEKKLMFGPRLLDFVDFCVRAVYGNVHQPE